MKIRRAGVFDESPTFAVCVNLSSEGVAFEVERDDGVARLRSAALVVSLGLHPFRLDVHRPDGSAVVSPPGTPRARAEVTSRSTTPSCSAVASRPEDAFYGHGEKAGRHNRRGRAFTLCNTDVLAPRTTAEFTAGRAAGDPPLLPEPRSRETSC